MAGLPKTKNLIRFGVKKQLTIMVKLLLFIYVSIQLTVSPLEASKKFLASLAKASPNDEIVAIIKMEKIDKTDNLFRNRKNYLRMLSAKTSASQQDLEKYLVKESNTGGVTAYRKFLLFNGFVVVGKAEVIKEIAKRTDVWEVHENYIYSVPDVRNAPYNQSNNEVEWGIDRIKADRVWQKYGYKGSNVKIGHLDTGVDAYHSDIEGKIADWAEFNYIGREVADSLPHDSAEHGTHTAGILVGGNSSGKYIGAAPDAKLLSAMVISGGTGSFAQIIAGMEWVIDPDGNPDTDDGADVVSMSIGAGGTYNELVEPIDNLIAAGILPVASIGNYGPGYTSSPGNIPSCFGVGAVDIYDDAAYFSSGEKVNWNYEPYIGNWTKPDVSAPGVRIKSSIPGNEYANLSGTSMACPLVAAAAALLVQANPELTPQQIKTILGMTSQDVGDEGKDTRFGWGIIDAYQAVQIALGGEAPSDDLDNSYLLPPMAYIYSPVQGKSVYGDAVSVIAGATASTEEVLFQYKAADEDEWKDISEAITKEPYSLYWDVTSLTPGSYQLRAVARSSNQTSSLDNEGIEIGISPNNPDIAEYGVIEVNPYNYHKRVETVAANQESEVIVADGTSVIIPPGTIPQNTKIEITNIKPEELTDVLPASESSTKGIGIYRKIEFEDGTHIFPHDISLVLPYVDDNDDGKVDGSDIDSSHLSIYYLKVDDNDKPVQWVKIEEEDYNSSIKKSVKRGMTKKSVNIRVNHFTLFAIMSHAPKDDLNEMIVYPNPSYNGADITFEGLTETTRIRIYTVSAGLVLDTEVNSQGNYVWKLKNDDGEKVSSGVYFYLVTTKSGQTKKGKLAVMR
ncbi:MAG: S8 family serine peptidase [bacterium]